MADTNQQDYYSSLVSAGSDPNATAEAKGNAEWAKSQDDYDPSYTPSSPSTDSPYPTGIGPGMANPPADQPYTPTTSTYSSGTGSQPSAQTQSQTPTAPDFAGAYGAQLTKIANSGPTSSQMYAMGMAQNAYNPSYTNFDPQSAAQTTANNSTQGTPGMSDTLFKNYTNLANSVDPTSSYWNNYRTLANQMGTQAYNQQKQGYQNTLDQLNAQKNNDLSSGQQALDNTNFQKYLSSRQGIADRGLSGSGLEADANTRLQLANAQNLQNLYNRVNSTYDPRIADTTTKQGLLNEALMQNDQFNNFYGTNMKNLSTDLKSNLTALGKTLPYDYASVNNKMQNGQAYDKMGLQNSQYNSSLQQKYDALSQKNQNDVLNSLGGYDKAMLPYQYAPASTYITQAGNQYKTDATNTTKTGIADAKNATDIANTNTKAATTIQQQQMKDETDQATKMYPYLFQSMNNKADNATKAEIAHELAQNNWDISKLSNDTKWKVASMQNTFNYDKLGADVKQWTEENHLKSDALTLDWSKFNEQQAQDKRMVDKASEAAKDSQTKMEVQGLQKIMDDAANQMKSLTATGMGNQVPKPNDPNYAAYVAAQTQYNNAVDAIKSKITGTSNAGPLQGPPDLSTGK